MPRLFGRPALRDSISSDHHASAVHALPAMHEDFFIRMIAQNREEFRDTVISHMRALRWNGHVLHPQLCHSLALVVAIAPQIHHDTNAHFGQCAESIVRRLSPAKERRRYLTEIGTPCKANFCANTRS